MFEMGLDRLIQALKYHARLQLAPWFAQALAPALPEVDRVVAVPLHAARLSPIKRTGKMTDTLSS